MTPFPSPQEVATLQAEAREALAQSETAEGLEKLRLINAAFPFAIQGTGYGLRISWTGDGWSISDTAGFITILPRDDSASLLVMIGMESARAGSVREVITGKKRASVLREVKLPEPVKRDPKKKLTLSELGLTNLKVGERNDL
jgi:hypothetical protein